jgi:inward rectifier potassium channel
MISKKIKEQKNTGFGSIASNYGGRLLNKDGTPNIKKTGVGFLEKFSWFHSMLSISKWHFFLVILGFFIVINFLFALIYLAVGVENLAGMQATTTSEKLFEAFFFSTQTFTTVGYGRISPTGFNINAVASFQALIGLLSFAVFTGLLYGRFSLPRAYIRFSENALISPYDDIRGLMIRMAPYKNISTLTDVEVKVSLALIVEKNGKPTNEFFNLKLEIDKINALSLSWTVVHPIDEESPLYKFTKKEFENTRGEVIVYLTAFDDTFSNAVKSRTSYTFDEVVYGRKFVPMYDRNDSGTTTILELDKLNDTIEMKVLEPQIV